MAPAFCAFLTFDDERAEAAVDERDLAGGATTKGSQPSLSDPAGVPVPLTPSSTTTVPARIGPVVTRLSPNPAIGP